MRTVDRLTTERYGIPSVILMENAAHAVARVITAKLGGSVMGKSILILCGKGNNGGDGAALARILNENGAIIEVSVFGKISESKGDASTNFQRLLSTASTDRNSKGSLFIDETPDMDDWFHGTGRSLSDFDLAVDAIIGTGLTRPLDNAFGTVPLMWNQRLRGADLASNDQTIRLSVDMPTGLNSDQEILPEIHFESDVTVTFTAPKRANVLPPASRSNGELVIADIGSPAELVDEQASELFLATTGDAHAWLDQTSFRAGSYKNKRGHALLVAGSKDYTGAAVLAGDAAIRSGAGLVTLAVPESSRGSVVPRVVPEVMVRGISETSHGSVAESAVDEIKGFLKNVDAIAIGSGLSTDEETAAFVRRMVDERTMPMVVDADALTALSPLEEHSQSLGSDRAPLIFTPHEGEFTRLLGVEKDEAAEILKDRVGAVRDFATSRDVVLVLKGERVLVGAPDGRVIVNPTGNSGLGKAGNGDTLTGILIGFIAQAVQMKIDIVETVAAACYVAGMAGDVAEKKYGKRVMTASDVRDCLVEVFDSMGTH